MAVIASATGAAITGGALAAGSLGAGLLGGAVLGAGAGALYSGITGDGDILNSALTGALLGGAAGGIGAAFAPAAAGGTGLTAATPLTGAGSLAPTTVSTTVPALSTAKGTLGATAFSPSAASTTQLLSGLGATAPVAGALPVASTYGTLAGAGAPAGLTTTQALSGLGAGSKVAAAMTPKQMLAAGLAGTTALSLLGERNQPKLPAQQTQGMIRPYTYSSKPTAAGGEYPSPYPTGPLYDAAGNPILDTRERNYFDQTFTAGEPYKAASGGLMAAGGPVERMSMMNTAINPQGGMYPQGMIDKTQYALPTQRPTSMEVLDAGAQRMFANGGITYDSATQRYSGLPEAGGAPAGDSTPLSAELIAQLTPQYQAANPNRFAYDPAQQRYSAATPTMSQLNAYKAEQDRIAASQIDPFMALNPFSHIDQFNSQFAAGGNVQGYNLGGYSDGGRLLKGPGDGVSDDIPATIGNRQPARLADGEFVIPARIVSELGNGSTDAGAKRLYAMMDKIQAGRKKTVGKGKVAVDSKAKKHLPA